MKTRIQHILILTLFMLVPVLVRAGAATQVTLSWQVSDGYGGPDGLFTDPKHYSGAGQKVVPDVGYLAAFNRSADYTVYFPDGSTRNGAGIFLNVAEDYETSFVGTNTVWTMANPDVTSADDIFPTLPFYCRYKNCDLVAASLQWSKVYNQPPLEFKDFRITCSGTDRTARFLFDGGLYNFRDAADAVWPSGAPRLMLAQTKQDQIPDCVEIVFTNSASLRAGDVMIGANSLTNVLVFSGGEHDMGAVSCPGGTQNIDYTVPAEVLIDVRDGAVFSFGVMRWGSYVSDSARTTRMKVCLRAAGEGSRLVARDGITMQKNAAGSNCIDIRDGASLVLSNTTRLATYAGYTTDVRVVNASLTVGSGAEFYCGAENDAAAGACMNLAATGSVLDLEGLVALDGAARWSLSGCAVTGVAPSLGSLSVPSESATLSIDGGTTVLSGDFNVGYRGNASLLIDGGNHQFSKLSLAGFGSQSAGLESTGVVEVAEGTCVVDGYIYGGMNSPSVSRIKVSGGTLSATALMAGWYGLTEIELSGGRLEVGSTFRLGSNQIGVSQQGTPDVFRQTGGELVCSATTVQGPGDGLGRTGLFILDGGRFVVKRLNGNGNRSSLEANGGTIVPYEATDSDFLYGFSSARLGAQGLTVDTPYDLTVPQAFSNLDTAEGVLIKKGVGSLALTSCESDQATLRIEEGSVFLPDSVVQYAPVVEIRDGLLDLGGRTVGTLTLGGLVLGDAAHRGTLKVTSSTRLAAPTFSGANVQLELVGTFAEGSYPLVTLTTMPDEASQGAWRRAFVRTGRVDGLSYVFTVEPDASDGTKTVLMMTVTDVSAPSTPVNWSGPSSGTTDWNDPDNWGGTLPDDRSVATFGDGAGMAQTVNVGTLSSVGALAFADLDYTLTGAGPLAVADSARASVSVSSGQQQVEVPLRLSSLLYVDVASGSSLTLSAPITHGGIVKTGDGPLTLAGTGHELDLGLQLGGGIFELERADAFTRVSDGVIATLAKGALKVCGSPDDPFARLPYKMTVATAAGKAFVIDTDANVTLPELSVTTGSALIKRGTGTLEATHEGTKTIYLANDGGSLPLKPLDFDTVDTVPTTGFGGWNVFEGELRLARGDKAASGRPTVSLYGIGFLGLRSTREVNANPGVVVDGLFAYLGHMTRPFTIAGDAYSGEYPEGAVEPYLYVTNNAIGYTDTLKIGTKGDASKESVPTLTHILVDGSELRVGKTITYAGNPAASVDVKILNGSMMSSDPATPDVIAGRVDLLCDGGSILCGAVNKTGFQSLRVESAAASGELLFRGGSTLRMDVFDYDVASVESDKSFVFAFDNGAWIPSDGDGAFLYKNAEHIALEARAGGFCLAPAAARTWTVYQPVSGSGGVVVSGMGTVRFAEAKGLAFDGAAWLESALQDARSLRTVGTNRIESGTLALASAAVSDGANFEIAAGAVLSLEGTSSHQLGRVVGPGTVSGGKIGTVRLSSQVLPVQRPAFSGSTFSGRLTVDLGRTAENPVQLGESFDVATVSGCEVARDICRLEGAGRDDARGRLSVANGVLQVTVERKGGLMLLVR